MRGGTRGAVSVFLSVILTPCIVVSGMFVDLSRVRLASALTASAGDLALDSLLTRYDFELSEFYGLMASCQNIEEYYDGAAKRFTAVLNPRALGDDEMDTVLAQILALLRDGRDAADLLRIDIKTDAGDMFTPVADANMANPAFIKSGIVSFMKYRAPVGLLLENGILQKLRATGGELAESEKNQPLIETRHEYYEAENTLRDKAYDIYDSLREYQTLTGVGPDVRLQKLALELESYRESYGQIHAIIAADVSGGDTGGEYPAFTLMGDGRTVAETLADICNGMAQSRAAAERSKALLDAASASLGTLSGYIGPYKDSFVSWDSAAASTDTAMAGTHLGEIEDIRDETGIDAIDERAISELKARVDGLSAAYGRILADMDGMRYGGMRVSDIASYDDAVWASGLLGASMRDGESLGAFVGRTFNFAPRTGPVLSVSAASARPNLSAAPAPSLYTWMASEFGGIERGSKRKSDAKLKDFLNMGKSESAASKESGSAAGGEIISLEAADFPSGFSGEKMSALSGLGGVADVAGELFRDFEGALTSMRDDLYTVEYVTGMFSHYAYEKEARYGLLTDDARASITWHNSATYYAGVTGAPEKRGTWLSESVQDVYNKSLTSRPVNGSNNFAYGAELEYILYGGKNSDNISKAVSSIYAIRYILNTPYAFMAFWGTDNNTGRAINAAAAAISAWSGGVVPVPLIKSAMILALVALETANDVQMLKAGLPVKLLKLYTGGEGDPDWVMQFDSVGEGELTPSERGGGSRGDAIRLSYGDYMYVFLALGYCGSGDLSSAMYKRTADVIQANVRLAAGGDASAHYSLEKAKIYIGMSATVRAKPFMLALPIASGYENSPADTEDWCTISYGATRGYGG
ncbi:MAG: DUF5702 domain-containing protein [Oscillospiraceae bacterium]|nr:DUF5702 domain-containing protein [Oscillospiraceae bacterium]